MKKYILIISLLFTTYTFGNLYKNGNVIKDDATNLQWQDTSDQTMKVFSWSDAIEYCENLELDGYSDWRLPNIVELSSIFDDTVYKPQISTIFENNRAGEFWSSTTYAKDRNSAWSINFDSGVIFYKPKSDTHFVRCVRSGNIDD